MSDPTLSRLLEPVAVASVFGALWATAAIEQRNQTIARYRDAVEHYAYTRRWVRDSRGKADHKDALRERKHARTALFALLETKP